MSEDREKGVQLALDFARNLVSLLFNYYFIVSRNYYKLFSFSSKEHFQLFFLRPKCSHLKAILCFVQGEVEKGRELIQEGIDMRKKLGVRVYVAAGYCDLGSEYRLFSL